MFLGRVLEILDSDMKTPTMYGWFHILSLAIMCLVIFLLCKHFKNPDKKTVRKIILIFSLISIALEIYKQVNYTFSYDGIAIQSDYQWYAFPFQFCSTPMYIGLFAAFVLDEKIHNALCAYLATFSLFAGVCVMAYPAQVFIDTIGINIQTMICHGSMVIVGVWLLYINYVKAAHKTILKAIPVFIVLVVSAAIMNEVAYKTGLLKTETFNMFFISPYCDPSLPVYSLVQAVVPFPLCTVLYVIAFSLAGYIMLLIAMAVKKISFKKKELINA